MTKPKLQLTDLQKRTFLLDIEKCNIPLDELLCGPILDRNPALYGPKGSELRKRMSTHFQNLRKKSIRNYIKQLEMYEIPISYATMRRYDQEYWLPHKNGAGEEEIETMGALMKEKPSFKAQTKTSQQAMTMATPSSPSKHWSNTSISTPPPSSVSSSSSLSPSPAERKNFLGSKLNPRIIHVNTDFPEMNPPFEVIDVDHIEANGYAYQGVEIRTLIPVGDHVNCHAWMKGESSILIKLPSRNKALDALSSFHRKDINSEAAKVRFFAKGAVDLNKSRQAICWELRFPEGYVLNNYALSGLEEEISREDRGFSYEHKDASFSVTVNCCAVTWRVAKAKTGYKLDKNDSKELKEMFG